MKIVVDENISFGIEAFSQFGDVHLHKGREISNDTLKDAEVLIVRSVTKVNKDLLKGTKIKFVGTATIGTDHVDTEYLKQNGISFADAAGCNSHAVKEYVFNSILHIALNNNISLNGKSLGVIGCGNIGSKVSAIGEKLGFNVLRNDPPLKRISNSNLYKEFDEVIASDIVTLHVPLNKTGIDKTYYLLDEKEINELTPGTILINSCRGPVVNNTALKKRLQKEKDIFVVLDVWENEPRIDPELLGLVDIASPHVAGYSLEGKVNGTVIVYEKLCTVLNQTPSWKPKMPDITDNVLKPQSKNIFPALYEIFQKVHSLVEDDIQLKKAQSMDADMRGKHFDEMRKTYRFRRELSNYNVVSPSDEKDFISSLEAFRLTVI